MAATAGRGAVGVLVGKPATVMRRAIARRVAREHAEQSALVLMIRTRLPLLHRHMTAIPAGGARAIKTATELKAEGVRAGYPDLLFDFPRGPFHGLRLELKRSDGVPSQVKAHQREFGALLNEAGYLAIVGFGAAHAFDQVAAYWELGPFSLEAPVDLEAFTLLDHEIAKRRAKHGTGRTVGNAGDQVAESGAHSRRPRTPNP